jgi:hypothetical protein
LYFGDRVTVLDDFIYQTAGSSCLSLGVRTEKHKRVVWGVARPDQPGRRYVPNCFSSISSPEGSQYCNTTRKGAGWRNSRRMSLKRLKASCLLRKKEQRLSSTPAPAAPTAPASPPPNLACAQHGAPCRYVAVLAARLRAARQAGGPRALRGIGRFRHPPYPRRPAFIWVADAITENGAELLVIPHAGTK